MSDEGTEECWDLTEVGEYGSVETLWESMEKFGGGGFINF